MKRQQIFLALLGLLTALVLIGHMRSYVLHRGTAAMIPDDFGAFYCGGKAVLRRQDPYRVGPILTCEQELARADPRWNKITTEGLLPAPLPGYAFVPLAVLATLPVRLAVLVFGLLLIGVSALIAYCVAGMSSLPAAVALAAVFVGITYSASEAGQIMPFAIAAIAAGALLLRGGNERAAAVASSGALIEPHVAIPVFIAMFLFLPRTRSTIAVIAILAAICNLAAVGISGTAEYLSVLSIHARSELNSWFQYSLTWVLHTLGVGGTTAIMGGSISYVALVAACLIILARNRERAIATGAVILLPATFAVFGGTFVHGQQISVALLPALVLVQPATVVANMLAAALLLVPFSSTQISTLTAIPSLLLTILTVWCVVFFGSRAAGVATATRTAVGITVFVSAFALLLFAIRPPHSTGSETPIMVAMHHPSALASLEEQRVNDAYAKSDHTPLSYYLLLKFPVWFGLAVTLWLSSQMLLTSGAPARVIPRTIPQVTP